MCKNGDYLFSVCFFLVIRTLDNWVFSFFLVSPFFVCFDLRFLHILFCFFCFTFSHFRNATELAHFLFVCFFTCIVWMFLVCSIYFWISLNRRESVSVCVRCHFKVRFSFLCRLIDFFVLV